MLTPEKIEEIKKELMALPPEEQQKKLQEVLANLTAEEREQLGGKQECPFCLMSQGKIPVKTVYEDDSIMGILDIHPANQGHVLLFPKEHAALMAQVADETLGHLFIVANKIASAIFEITGAEGTNVVVSNGQVAGQTAPHFMVNIIPRKQGDKVSVGWQPCEVKEDEQDKIANAIRDKVGSLGKKKVVKKDPSKFDKEEKRIP